MHHATNTLYPTTYNLQPTAYSLDPPRTNAYLDSGPPPIESNCTLAEHLSFPKIVSETLSDEP